MYSQHNLLLDHTADAIYSAFLTLPPEYKWGDGLLYPDHATLPPEDIGETRLILRDGGMVIEEYTETLIESETPRKLALTLKLDDFAMSRNAPKGELLPSAATLSRARARIKEGHATNLMLALALQPQGTQTTATLTFATTGQTAPKMGANLFKGLRRNPAKTLLDWFATHLDAITAPPSSS